MRGATVDVDDRADARLLLDLSAVVPVRGRLTLGPGLRLADVRLEVVDGAGDVVRTL